MTDKTWIPSQWRHNGRDSVSNHQPHDCLLNRLFRRRSKKTSKLRVTGLCEGNPPVTGEFPAQMASNAENISTWWRHHVPNRTLWENVYQINNSHCNIHHCPHEGLVPTGHLYPDSKVHGANMGPTWVLSAPDGPHVGLMNLAIRVGTAVTKLASRICAKSALHSSPPGQNGRHFADNIFRCLFTPQPFGLEGYCRHGSGGRAGGYQTCGTHISVNAWRIFSIRSSVELSRPVVVHCHGHLPICPIWACPWAKNFSNQAALGPDFVEPISLKPLDGFIPFEVLWNCLDL